MGEQSKRRETLVAEIDRLEHRIRELKSSLRHLDAEEPTLVDVPAPLRQAFQQAQDYVREYFKDRVEDPQRARIEYSGERYILIRAASLSTEFFDLVTSLYRDRGTREARSVAHSFLFDVGHALGKADAKKFHDRMGVTDPVQKLSAGPLHFAFSGWARVIIHPESNPSPDEDFFLAYDHPNSFEAEAWLDRGSRSEFPVCTMNAGYSSGWCEQSFDVPLVAAEVECRAMGAERCRFVMAPPARIEGHLERLRAESSGLSRSDTESLEVPELFRRKRLEDDLRRARDDLERRVTERTAELQWRMDELRRANERMEELHRAREEFVATISHELRTPLVTGLGYIELLLAGKLGSVSRDAHRGVEVAERNLRRLAGLVDDILSYHRLTVHGAGPGPEPVDFDLTALCRESVDDFLVRSDRDRAKVAVRAPEDLPTVVADPEMILRVLANLLDNAGRYAGDSATIEVSLTPLAGEKIRVAVSDDGPGMPPEVSDSITEPFVRGGSGGPGLGLGLSIVRSLLDLHGSQLQIKSEAGQGTTASFDLPVGGPAEAEGWSRPVPRPPTPWLAEGRPVPRILVVDDDEDTVDFVELALSGEGFRVATAASAEEALERLGEEPAELMLVDLSLPGMSGTDLCRRIKGDPETAEMSVFLFTARAEESPRREAREAGCDGYLVKPLSLDDLLNRVRRAVAAGDSADGD